MTSNPLKIFLNPLSLVMFGFLSEDLGEEKIRTTQCLGQKVACEMAATHSLKAAPTGGNGLESVRYSEIRPSFPVSERGFCAVCSRPLGSLICLEYK